MIACQPKVFIDSITTIRAFVIFAGQSIGVRIGIRVRRASACRVLVDFRGDRKGNIIKDAAEEAVDADAEENGIRVIITKG